MIGVFTKPSLSSISLSARICPSSIAAGATMSLPACTCESAVFASTSFDASFTRYPSSRIPQSEEHTSESSHTVISYAVFCLKKKKKKNKHIIVKKKKKKKKIIQKTIK